MLQGVETDVLVGPKAPAKCPKCVITITTTFSLRKVLLAFCPACSALHLFIYKSSCLSVDDSQTVVRESFSIEGLLILFYVILDGILKQLNTHVNSITVKQH